MICREHRCIFVHIPKTGGTTLEVVLTGHDWVVADVADYDVYLRERNTWRGEGSSLDAREPGYFTRRLREKHATAAALAARYPTEWANYRRVTFVRNPWDRVASVYRHGRRDAPDQMPETFGEWIRQREPRDHVGQLVFQPWITDWDACHFVGRFERFAEDAAALLTMLEVPIPAELPRVDHGGRPDEPSVGYDAETIAIVAERCHQEIDRFGYRATDSVQASRPVAVA